MYSSFYRCSSLEELYISNFNTNKVTDMNSMFFGCLSLKELNLSNFNVSNVNNMFCMFYGCSLELKKKIKDSNCKLAKKAFI